jgi:hypothetical protein
LLAAETAVAAAGDEGLPRQTAAPQDPNGSPEQDPFESLLGPRLEKEYFTPFEQMRPDFPARNLHLEIGQWKDMQVLMGFQAVTRFRF